MYKIAEIGDGTKALLATLHPELDPVAFVNISEKKLNDAVKITKHIKEQMKGIKEPSPVNGYTDYREMILKEKPDIVVVGTPNRFHAEMSIFALEHGANVMVEKPMCIALDDCQRMVETVRKTGLKLNINQSARTIKHFQYIFDRLRDGDIGVPYYVRSEYQHGSLRARLQTHGDLSGQDPVLLAGGSHSIDLVLGLIGESPCAVSGSGSRYMTGPNCKVNDLAAALIHFPSGKTGYAISAHANHRRQMGMAFELYGTNYDIIQDYTFVDKDKDISEYGLRFYGKDNERFTVSLDQIGKTQSEIGIGHGQGPYRQLENLLYAIKYDVKQPTMADVVDGAKTTAVALMAEKSIVTGKTEGMPYWEPIHYKGRAPLWKLDDYQKNMLRDFVPLLSAESRKQIIDNGAGDDQDQFHATSGEDD